MSTTGLIDIMSKILSKPSSLDGTDQVILSKAKQIEKRIDQEARLEREKKRLKKEQKQKEEELERPSLASKADPALQKHLHPEHEKRLRKIATRGVVKLFNAFQQQQQAKQAKKGKDGVEKKGRDKNSKSQSAFMEYLNNTNKDKNENTKSNDTDEHSSGLVVETAATAKHDKKKGAEWMKQEYLLLDTDSANLKDWDKIDDDDE